MKCMYRDVPLESESSESETQGDDHTDNTYLKKQKARHNKIQHHLDTVSKNGGSSYYG